MPLPALHKWCSSRLPRLDRLMAAHPRSAGSKTDPAVAQEWTRALVLMLASESQGFCRDLHDDAAEMIAQGVVGVEGRILDTILSGMTVNRGLNRRSADLQTLEGDFLCLGVSLWPAMSQQHPVAAPAWLEALRCLHKARNGIVHDDIGSVATAQAAGWPLELTTVRSWRKVLDEVALVMGGIVDREISKRFEICPSQGGDSR
jgi:hypothetical protein